jgi:Na+-transporting methylmalonyl-CoA/oxaloacetate decarboxylase gamma subunit
MFIRVCACLIKGIGFVIYFIILSAIGVAIMNKLTERNLREERI